MFKVKKKDHNIIDVVLDHLLLTLNMFSIVLINEFEHVMPTGIAKIFFYCCQIKLLEQ